MAACATCGTEFAVRLCPNCGGAPAVTNRKINQALVKYCAVTVFLALFIAGNGALDQSPVTPVRTTLISKQVTVGRYGRLSYTLRVRSWRAGRATEDFNVSGRTYRTTSTEKAVVVEIHRGRLGLPWYSGVFSE